MAKDIVPGHPDPTPEPSRPAHGPGNPDVKQRPGQTDGPDRTPSPSKS